MLKSRYITLDDFKQFSGIDLIAEMGETAANALLYRTEIRMEAFLNARMFQDINKLYCGFTEFQKQCYKNALLEQLFYIWKNGDITLDNGYDQEAGLKIDEGNLIKLTIARNAKEQLMLCGLWSYKLKGHGIGVPNLTEWFW